MLLYRPYQINAGIYGFKVMATLKYGTLYIEAIIQMIILIAPNYIGRDNTPVTIPRLAVG